MDFTQFMIFIEIMRHRNLTVAATHLGLTQSAVSHALKRLRDTFDDELFIRQRTGVEPTALARELEPQIIDVVERGRKVLTSNEDFMPSETRRRFSIGGLDYEQSLLMPSLIKTLEVEAPNIQIAFKPLARKPAIAALVDGSIDLSLGVHFREPPDVTRETLLEETFVAVVRKEHPIARKKLTLKRFVELDHLEISITGSLSGRADRALSDCEQERRVVASVPLFFSALATVQRSDLVAVVPSRLAKRYTRAFDLKVKDLPVDVGNVEISMIQHRRSHSDRALAWLRAKIREAAADVER